MSYTPIHIAIPLGISSGWFLAQNRKGARVSKVDFSVGYWPHGFPSLAGLCGLQISVSGGPRTNHSSKIKLGSDFVGIAYI